MVHSLMKYFTEKKPYDCSSPYSSSKAYTDHLVRAWHHIYGLLTIITMSSSNYGLYQFLEKLIPVVILKTLRRNRIPEHGGGENIGDWLFVDDHARALINIGEDRLPEKRIILEDIMEKKNIEVVDIICLVTNKLAPKESKYREQVIYATDRPGHDFRYAIDTSKIVNELKWILWGTFEMGIEATIKWCLENMKWIGAVTGKNFDLERLSVQG